VFGKMQDQIAIAKTGNPVDWLERGAVGASFLCLVHCLALPFLIAALPTLATVLPVSERFHVWILAFAVPAAMIALWSGRSQHGATGPLLTGIAGLVLLLIGAVVLGETRWETGVTVAGSLTLALAHVRNWRMRRSLSCEQHRTSVGA
jgi:hypothetical protein